ncbi:MAG: hypothetical protein ACLR6O_00775 [Eubacterium sp.]
MQEDTHIFAAADIRQADCTECDRRMEHRAGGSKYTMDANVNLQTSSMNTSNMQSTPIGYGFILRQLPDWEENAYATHGYKNALQAPVNTDGDKAVITETCYPYPFRY